ncbi:1,4-dihydroxy-2-naphthoyl-CoA synthase [Ferrimonas gelatinilytica]|uniref:1,4-dihydroxy-2-naphthoyl-CoA synthase n=1 Tax=Ferrimonas gelatinilytica TaxID=1255257 RepID=A0ABP9S8Q3_9GAMM
MTQSAKSIFNPELWDAVPGFNFDDITYHRAKDQGTVRIAFNRPDCLNSFRPKTVDELFTALDHARQWSDVGCVLITGNGPSKKGQWSFSAGGDQRIRGKDGYKYEGEAGQADVARMGRLHILEVQRLIRFMPKVVIALVPGWAVGGGHSLHVVCDLTLASEEHAVFKQTDPDVASFDSGYGSAYLAKMIGQKRAREIFFCGFDYSAQEAYEMGMVNKVVPHFELEEEALRWGAAINSKSPTAMRMLKYGFNLPDDGLVGQQLFAGEATRLAYGTEEAQEGRDAFLEKRAKDFSKFPWHY